MKKAFFINGGAGRVLCAIPALENYAKKHDDFIIVSEGWPEIFAGNKTLQDKVYNVSHKDLFENHLKDCELVSPEPYRLNQYFNQKCNLIQAFDIIINELDHIPKTQKITIELNKKEQIDGHNLVGEVRSAKQKEKVVVFQPFGSSVQVQGQFIFDSSGRSFELNDVYKLIELLTKHYGVIVMSPFQIPSQTELGFAWPQNVSIRTWMGIINAADYFVGCDSLGQHLAHALNKPTTVVIGSTFPENISYLETKNFTIVDNGLGRRKYSPIRITMDDFTDRTNEELMVLSKENFNKLVESITKVLKTNTTISNVKQVNVPHVHGPNCSHGIPNAGLLPPALKKPNILEQMNKNTSK